MPPRQQLGINSLEIGLRLARVLGEHGLPLALKDLAARADMPLANSATGRLFAAYLPDAVTAPILKAEFARTPEAKRGYAERLEEIRARGLSRVQGDLLRGVASVAAPVFGHGGGIVAVIAALGPPGGFNVALDCAIATA